MKHENRKVFHIRADNGDDNDSKKKILKKKWKKKMNYFHILHVNDSIVSDKEKAALFFF